MARSATRRMDGELTGTVVGFEADRGLGEVADESGQRFPFHCIDIADGSRSIEVDAAVRFGIRPKLGRYEAVGIARR